jgi:NAD(P)-dependent dehydrogenase (short-subunit alcohol dehydrogenase family)
MKTCIITGANSGIGKSAAEQIAAKGWRVILACRNVKAAEKVCDEIKAMTNNKNVYAMKVDLSLMSEIRAFAGEFITRFGELDVLINNAADFDLSRKTAKITSEGNEAQFATNVLAPFLLTNSLIGLMKNSNDARIINVSSQGLMVYPKLKLDFDNFKAQKNYKPASTYYQNKLALLMNSLTLKEKYLKTNISVNAVRVTNVKIDMSRYQNINAVLKFMYKIKRRFSISPDEMAKVYTNLATENKAEGFLYDEKMQEVKANKFVYEVQPRIKLWKICDSLTTQK